MTTNNNSKKISAASTFLTAFCETHEIDKAQLRASTNRAEAKKIQEVSSQYNGLTPEVFASQFKDLMDYLTEVSMEGETSIRYKYTTKETTDNEEIVGDEVIIKCTPTDYMVSKSIGGKAFSKAKLTSPKDFRRMLSAPLTHSALRELGYKVDKTLMQSNRRGNRVFDVITINWSVAK